MLITVRPGIPILLYHSIDESGSTISVSPDVFRRHVRYLYENEYRSVSFLEALKHVRSSGTKSSRDDKPIIITFDDGYQTVYTHGLPLLERYGFKATVFLSTGLLGREIRWKRPSRTSPSFRMLTWDEINLMNRCGVEFGAHTVTHRFLTSLPVELARREILQSKALIEQNIGKSVDVFAFPSGKTNESLRGVVRHAFRAACTSYPGVVTAESDPYHLPRLSLEVGVFHSLITSLPSFSFPHLCIAWKRLTRAVREAAR